MGAGGWQQLSSSSTRHRRSALLLLALLMSWCSQEATGLTFVFLPFMGGNSPAMDLMGVAAALQARCGCLGRRGGCPPWQLVTGEGLACRQGSRNQALVSSSSLLWTVPTACNQLQGWLQGLHVQGFHHSRLPTPTCLCCVPASCAGATQSQWWSQAAAWRLQSAQQLGTAATQQQRA